MKSEDYEKVILIHFGELWLRGRNRGMYIRKLGRNIDQLMADEKDVRLEKLYDRFILRLGPNGDLDSVKEKLRHVFGISNYEIAYVTESKMAAILKLAKHMLSSMERKPLKINAHRSYKELDFNSMQIMEKAGKLAKKMKFELTNKGFVNELKINVTKDVTFVSNEKVKAFGGLPVGTSGKGVILISGGIDSPVAAWYAMKRGIEPVYLHVHGYPEVDSVLNSKMQRILKELSRYSPNSKVYYIPSHIFQISAIKAGKYELILLKAFMMMAAEKVAEKEGAELIFTGESLGQVASQTSSNIGAESEGIKMPILRPLIGFDKEEIIKIARIIGTYDYSIMPYKDVCSINSRNPKTQTSIEKIKELKKKTNLKSIVNRTLKAAHTSRI